MGIIGTITKKRNPKSCLKLGFIMIPIYLLSKKRIKLILHEGTTKIIKRRTKIKAGEIMFEFPDCVVCHANSFFLNKPIPILSIHDHLVPGHTYFILPLDRLPGAPEGGSGSSTRGNNILSTASLCSLGSPASGACPSGNSNKPSPVLVKLLNGDGSNDGGNSSPFEYVKDKDGRVLMIKVVPEFITRVITSNYGEISPNSNNISGAKLICSTPELQKQYEQLVRAKEQAWSPKLETITEHKKRSNYYNVNLFSPSRLIRLDWNGDKKEINRRLA